MKKIIFLFALLFALAPTIKMDAVTEARIQTVTTEQLPSKLRKENGKNTKRSFRKSKKWKKKKEKLAKRIQKKLKGNQDNKKNFLPFILSLVGFWFIVIGIAASASFFLVLALIASICGIVFGAAEMKKGNRHWAVLTGFILGIVNIALPLTFILIVLGLVLSGGF